MLFNKFCKVFVWSSFLLLTVSAYAEVDGVIDELPASEGKLNLLIRLGHTAEAKTLAQEIYPIQIINPSDADKLVKSRGRQLQGVKGFKNVEEEAVFDEYLKSLVDKGRNIVAIKAYRTIYRVGLKEAKDKVDTLMPAASEPKIAASKPPRSSGSTVMLHTSKRKGGPATISRNGVVIKPGSKLWDDVFNRPATEIEISVLQSQAENGKVGAQFELGRIYAGERGNPVDIVKAKKYFEMAVASGSSKAKLKLENLEKNNE